MWGVPTTHLSCLINVGRLEIIGGLAPLALQFGSCGVGLLELFACHGQTCGSNSQSARHCYQCAIGKERVGGAAQCRLLTVAQHFSRGNTFG